MTENRNTNSPTPAVPDGNMENSLCTKGDYARLENAAISNAGFVDATFGGCDDGLSESTIQSISDIWWPYAVQDRPNRDTFEARPLPCTSSLHYCPASAICPRR
jgi:hypothetical protein